MKSRGFTLLEVLMAIGLFGTVTGLAWTAYNRTMSAHHQGEARVERLLVSMRSLEEIGRLFPAMNPDRAWEFSNDRVHFSIETGSKAGDVEIYQSPNDVDSWVYKVSLEDQPVIEQSRDGQIRFQFLDINTWMSEWENTQVPRAVSISVVPAKSRSIAMEPFQLVVNLPFFSTIPVDEMQQEQPMADPGELIKPDEGDVAGEEQI